MLSDVIRSFGGPEHCTDLIPGIVGEGAAVEFGAFLRQALNESQMLAIVQNPSKAKVPSTLDGLYVLTTWLAFNANRDGVKDASALLLGRIPAEFAMVLARDMLKALPSFARTDGYKTFMRDHGRLLSR
jgi:hypothetical protein